MTRQSKEPQQESMWFEDAREAKEPVDRVEEERIINAALGILEARCSAGEVIENPRAVSRYLQLRLAPLQNECFAALYLDTRHRVLAFREHFHGTIDGAAVYPRVIVKTALDVNAGRDRNSVQISNTHDRIVSNANATFAWNVLDLGVSYARAKQTADEVLITQEQERQALPDIVRQVNTAFWRAAGCL